MPYLLITISLKVQLPFSEVGSLHCRSGLVDVAGSGTTRKRLCRRGFRTGMAGNDWVPVRWMESAKAAKGHKQGGNGKRMIVEIC